MSSPVAHAAHAPQGFIRKYIFSLDHKVIGIQYYLPGAVQRVYRHVALAADALPHGQSHRAGRLVRQALAHGRGGRRDDAGTVSFADDHARHHHGVLRAHHGAAERLRQLFPADPDRRRGHGVPGPEHDVVLDHLRGAGGDGVGVLRAGRRAALRLDGLPAALRRRARHRSGRRHGPEPLDYQYRHLLRRVPDGRHQLHRHHRGPALQGHDADADAAHLLDLAGHRHPGPAGFRRAAGGRRAAAARPHRGHQLLPARRAC